MSSVLLAFFVGVGMLFFLPALVHRYDTYGRHQTQGGELSIRVLDREAWHRRQRKLHRDMYDAAQTPVSPEEHEPSAEVDEVSEQDDPEQEEVAVPQSSMASHRRRVLLVALLTALGCAGAAVIVNPVWWAPAGIITTLVIAYMRRVQRVLRRVRAQRERAAQLRAAHVRRARQFCVQLEEQLGLDRRDIGAVYSWLRRFPHDRSAPSNTVLCTLAAAGREPYRCEAEWYVRRAPASDAPVSPRNQGFSKEENPRFVA